MKIEIYNKKTNEVLEVKEIENLKSFMYYWINQANTETYSYRIQSQLNKTNKNENLYVRD